MRHTNVADRVRLRIAQWLKDEGHGSKNRLAKAVPSKYGQSKNGSWVTEITRDPSAVRASRVKAHDVRLRDLDAIADAMGIPIGELVQRDGSHYIEATPTELRLMRYFRTLPDDGKQHWIAHLDALFAPLEREQAAEVKDRPTTTRTRRRLG